MDRESAERERERMAAEHPEATWLVAERAPGDFAVVKVGLTPPDAADGSATEERPAPPYPDDPRSWAGKNTPYGAL